MLHACTPALAHASAVLLVASQLKHGQDPFPAPAFVKYVDTIINLAFGCSLRSIVFMDCDLLLLSCEPNPFLWVHPTAYSAGVASKGSPLPLLEGIRESPEGQWHQLP
jgi:hypothetical protein